MNFEFLKHRKIYYIISSILVLASIGFLVVFGIVPGIEFAGGSVLEVEYEERPSMEKIYEDLRGVGIREADVQPVGEEGLLIRTERTDDEVYEEVMGALEGAESRDFESIGAQVGDELKTMSLVAIILASLLVIIYIAVSFRDDDGSISSGKYGIIATGVAFLHDMLIVLGIFSVLGYLYGVQVTIPIAVALLTTLGYSINDTVVIFDRIRENLINRKERNEKVDLKEVVNNSLNETFGRSVGTSLTTLFILLSLLILGGATIFYFILALIFGIILGMYSSIFLAGPLVLDWNSLTKKEK